MLRWRLLLGTLFIAGLAGLCYLDYRAETPGVWLMPVVVILALAATQEMLDLLAAVGMKPQPWLVYAGNLLAVLGGWIQNNPTCADFLGSSLDFCSIESVAGSFLFVLFLVEICRYRKPGGAAANLAGGVLAFLYIGVMLRLAVSIRSFGGIGALVSWIAAVKMGDTGAYCVGRLIGRRKMAPYLSPGKTLEGAVGALAFACLGAWAALDWWAARASPGVFPLHSEAAAFPCWAWIVYGLWLGMAGMIADLAESLLKREAGRKDSSAWMPGFGGALDILDSLLLSAPLAWLFWMMLEKILPPMTT